MAQSKHSQPEEEEEVTLSSPLVGTSADALLKDAERRQELERDLTRMGMSAQEVRQLLNANSTTSEAKELLKVPKPTLPTPKSTAPPTLSSPKHKKRTSAEELQSFAADLMAKKSAEKVERVQVAMKGLPEFREASIDQKRAAENLMREASLLRRKERYKEAEEKCRTALELVPKDAASLEFLGDVLQGVARNDEALAAYKRALEADPKRTSAEAKYADLLTLQENYEAYDPEEVSKNPWVSALMSALLPGAGQIYNGEWFKSIFFGMILAALYLYRAGSHVPTPRGKMDWNQMMFLIIVGVIWVVAIADASISAKRLRDNSHW